MLKNLKRVVYRVGDLQEAKKWYSMILGSKPVMDSPFAVSFAVGESTLILSPRNASGAGNDYAAVAYFDVDDIDVAFQRFVENGATAHNEIRTFGGSSFGEVKDPFGNILGITGRITNDAKRSVENEPSETAMGVAYARALAAIEEREEIRGHDNFAEIFLDERRKNALNNPAVREWIMKNHLPPGLYEYLIARTTFFDDIFKKFLIENIPQIVFLGAGYDSRSYRFCDLIKDTKIFELDIQPTQERKKEILKLNKVAIPQNLAFIRINFKTETIEEVLSKAGFDRNKKTLFIWEGVTFYLTPALVDETLSCIRRISPVGSSVCFDYSSITEEGMASDEARARKEFWINNHPAEPMQFGIEESTIDSFMNERFYEITDHLTSKDMERRYLVLKDGSLAGKIPPFYGLIHAAVKEK